MTQPAPIAVRDGLIEKLRPLNHPANTRGQHLSVTGQEAGLLLSALATAARWPEIHPDLFKCYCGAVLRRDFQTVEGAAHVCPLNRAQEAA